MPLSLLEDRQHRLARRRGPAAEHAATLSLTSSFLAFSAKVGQSGAVFLDDLDLAAENAAGFVDLVDRERSASIEPVSEIAMVPVAECRCRR
jgi:hypothetical protein